MDIPDRPVDFDEFDPYYRWLGIAKKFRPPSYYQLLGVSVTESDRSLIESAMKRQQTHVLQYRGTQYDEIAARLLFEIELAATTLLSPQLRREYDLTLRSKRVPWEIWRRGKPQGPAYNPSTPVGEGAEIVRSFAGVMSVILLGFAIMATLSFNLPWQKIVFNGGNDDPVQGELVNGNAPKSANQQPRPLPSKEVANPEQANNLPPDSKKKVEAEPSKDILASIDAVITKIDVENRSVSAKHGEKTADFDISKSTAIMLDGKQSTLAALKVGQSATIEFNAEYDVALKIEASTTPPPPVALPAASSTDSDTTDSKQEDTVAVDATVVSVDLDNRLLTVKAGAKRVQLELSRKSEVLLDDKPSSLEQITAGQSASISFNPKYDIVTRIELSGTGTPATFVDPIVSTEPTPDEPPDDPDLVSVDVELESIDTEQRSLTVIRKSKPITFELSRKAKVTINGKESPIENLKPKQTATISFDPEYEIISRIDAKDPSTETEQPK